MPLAKVVAVDAVDFPDVVFPLHAASDAVHATSARSEHARLACRSFPASVLGTVAMDGAITPNL